MNPQGTRLMPVDPSANIIQRPPPMDDGEEGASLREYLATLIGARWLIVATTLLAVVGGALYYKLVPPTYRSDTLLQVEEKKKGIAGLEDMAAMFPADSVADTEIEILRSRSLVQEVVEKLSLDIDAHPRHLPLLGSAMARSYRGSGLSRPLPGFDHYGWGGERIVVDRFSVPEHLENQKLLLIAGEGGRYRLLGADGELLLEGEVGKAVAGREGVSIFVSELKGRPGCEFRLVKRPLQEAVEDLQTNLAIAERGKKTGIIRAELSGPDVPRLVATLNALSEAYVRQNVARKSEEAERTLQFVNSQLPELKVRLDQAEEALNAYRAKHGTIDLTLESKAAVESAAMLEKSASELQLQRAELKQRFTESHPVMSAVNRKLAEIDGERTAINARIKRLPESELNSVRLLRDVKVANELYVLLLNKAQELRVVKSGTIGNVRILDRAFSPRKPVHPRAGNTFGLALVIGFGLGVTLAFARRALNRGIEDPDVLEAVTGLSVYATIPHSAVEAQLARDAKRNGTSGALLATRDPTGLSIESLRSLRTSLQFALMESPNNLVAFSGPSPGIGKSFVSSNFAHVASDSGKRVLLVDADLRNGTIHRGFGLKREHGLSELVAGSLRFDDAVHRISDRLDVLTQGQIPPNPSELLMSQRFRDMITDVSKRYDLVVIDTPPILAVTDAAIIGRLTGVTLLVVRSGLHPAREVKLAVTRFVQGGVRLAGLVFNDVPASTSGYGYGYHYDYRRKSAG